MRTPRLLLVVALLSCSGGPKARPPLTPDVVAGDLLPPDREPAPPAAEAPLPLWPQVRHGMLPNGLTYYVLPHRQPAQRAAMWLAINAGSLQEDDDQQGLAHFVEHMAFNGTARFAKQGIIDYLEKIGMEFGPDVNAFTSWDETVYQLQIPTDDASYVGTGLDILRDWAGGLSFDPIEVDKERGVVLEEWRLRKGAFDRLLQKQASVIWGGTRYAVRLPIGLPEIITKAPRAAAVRFYQDWYRPDLMAVIVVGDVDADTMIKDITARFADLKGPATPRPRQSGGALDRSGPKVSIETDPELPRTSVAIQNLFPHRRESHASDYAKFVVDSLYHQILGERLDQLGRTPDAPYIFASSSTGDQTREFEAFSRTAFAKDGQIEATLDVLLTEVLRIERHGFTAAELARAKKTYLNRSAQSAAEWDKQESTDYADELTRHFFQGELVIGRVAEDELARTVVPEVTLDEVNHLAQAWGGLDTRAIVISAPATARAVPSTDRVLALAKEVEARTLTPWVEAEVPTTLMAQRPTAGAIASERVIADLGVTEWTLGNGVKVVVKPTDFENQTIHLAGRSPGGLALATDAGFPSARLAGEAVVGGGLAGFSADQLDKFLSDKSVSLFPWIGEVEEGVGGRAATADLETLLQLVYLRLTAPRKDAAAFAAWQRGRMALLERRDAMPEVGLSDLIQTTLTSNHKRRRPLTAADVGQVDLDAALAFYRDRFGDASDFTFTITGNVDVATLRPLVETYLASLPGQRGKEPYRDVGVKLPKRTIEKTVKRGVEPKAAVQLVFHGDDAWSVTAERDADVLASVLEMRLREILREDMGGVYGVGVYGRITRVPNQRRQFWIRFGCAPDNVAALKRAVFTELARMQQDGVTQDYLDKVKEVRRRSHEIERRRNEFWLDALSEAAAFGDDPHEALALDPVLARITSDHVRDAARRFTSTKRYVLGVMVPTK